MQAGIGIPMATDIAFALGVVAFLGNRVPASLKVFVVAYAVIDDLCAIIIIAVYYTTQLAIWYLVGAVAVWGILILLNRFFRMMSLIPYLVGGALMWFLMLKSGVHATIPEFYSRLQFRFLPNRTTKDRLRTGSNTFYINPSLL